MSKGILTKPTKENLEYTVIYLLDNPTHLYKIDLTNLRVLSNYIVTEKKAYQKKPAQKTALANLELALQMVDARIKELEAKKNSGVLVRVFSGRNAIGSNNDFSSLFTSPKYYNGIMRLLVSQDIIDRSSHLYLDRGKGHKSYLIVIIKQLQVKGYYRYPPTNEEIQRIALNSFGVRIGIDTIKKTSAFRYKIDFIGSRRGSNYQNT